MLINFFKKNFVFIYFLMLNSLLFSRHKILNLLDINNYNGVFLWKYTNLLNNLSINLIVILFLIFFILILTNFFKKEHSVYYVLIIYYLIFYKNTVNAYFIKITIPLIYKKINMALLNGILNIHPWITFMCYSLLLFFLISFFFRKDDIKRWFFRKNFVKYRLIILVTCSIFLGSYWAFQELSWGGWWNWDIVELISLNLFFFSLLIAHNNYINIFYKNINIKKFILIFLISIIIIRFNLLNSIHSFIDTNNNKMFLKNFVVICIYTYIFYIFFRKYIIKHSLFKKKSYFIYFNMHIITIIIYASYHFFNVFFFKNDFTEFSIFFEFVFLCFLCFCLVSFLNLKLNKSYHVFYNVYPNNFLIILYFYIKYNIIKQDATFFKKYHITLIMSFIIIYFLKIYFNSKSIFIEIYFYKNHNTLYFYNNNNFFKKINMRMQENIFLKNMFYNFNINIEFKSHYYKNTLVYFYNFFIKVIKPNSNFFIILYSNLFFVIVFLITYVIVVRVIKNIKIN